MTLLSARQLARELGVHPNTVRRIPASELPFYRLGTRLDRRYDRADVDAYLAARRVSGREEPVRWRVR